MGHNRIGLSTVRTAAVILAGIGIALLSLRPGWAFDSSGLELKLYADQSHEDFKYLLGQDPVRIHLAIRNIAAQPIVTSRGYSQVELYNHIFVTDPAGVQHILGRGEEVHKMPPPFFINDLPWALAESLPAGWVRTVTFADLRILLPMMRTVPGWYTIEARQPFIRFAESGQDAGLGLLGLLDRPSPPLANWEGTVRSKSLQIFIAPLSGARLDLRVVDASAESLAQVPVKVFTAADLPAGSDPVEAWDKTSPAASGTTDSGGQVTWDEGEPCFPKGDYVAVILYQGEYHLETIDRDNSAWEDDCNGLLALQIEAGVQYAASIGEFSLVALNSLRIGKEAEIISGSVGVQDKSDGPWLCANDTELCLDNDVRAAQSKLYADTIQIEKDAVVQDVFFNELVNNGTISGERITPLDSPVARLPGFLGSQPGSVGVTVKKKQIKTLEPGSYGAVLVQNSGTLELTAGIYDFESLTLSEKSSLVCIAPCSIRVKERLSWSEKVTVGPAEDAAITAGDIVFHVGGKNGSDGLLASTPKAVFIGEASRVSANIYAPNGTLQALGECTLEGAFIARDVQIGQETTVKLNSGF